MKNKTMYAVCYAMAPRVQVLDEWFDDEDEALDAALEAIEIGVQYDTTGDYDPDVEMAYLCIVPITINDLDIAEARPLG